MITDDHEDNKTARRKPCKASPELREALERHLERFSHTKAFPFLDPRTCWDLEEFARENQRAIIEEGLRGQRLIDHMCRWAADGRMAFLVTEKELYLFVRTWEREDRLI